MEKRSKHKRKRVALIGVPVLHTAYSAFDAAVARYAVERGHWDVVFSMEPTTDAFKFLRRLDCDGALVRIISPKMRSEALHANFPMVNFSGWLKDPGVPTVRRNDAAMGRLCAEHLLEKGFRRFGVVTLPGGWFIKERGDHFVATVRQQCPEADLKFYELKQNPLPARDVRSFRDWVAGLQTPAGLFLTDDEGAPAIMDICREAGRRIPHDLAVVAGFGHEHIVPACQPPLSAAWENSEAIATGAAKLLDDLMEGKARGAGVMTVSLPRLVAMKSTDTVAVDDREVARSLEFIREHAGDAINVADVVKQATVARVTLERRFRTIMGISPHDYLVSERVRRARHLLRTSPELNLEAIARRCGFIDRKQLNRVFRRLVHISPRVWRKSS